MTRILIADDHAMVREGLRQILAEEWPQAHFGEAGTTQDTLAQLRQQAWHVLLLDVFMPGGGGLEILREVRLTQPQLPVLVVSSAPEEQLALRVLQNGAAGYLSKQAAAAQLVQALHKVLAGGKYVSGKMAEKLVGHLASPSAPVLAHERLSDREFQVLQLLVAGKSLKDIAAALCLSPKTISTFHTRILEKLELQNDVALVHYALEHHLLERPGGPGPT